MAVHFKYTGTKCLPGKWHQIVRSTTYVGESEDDLKPAHLVDGRMVPHSDSEHQGDWEIDTNKAGREAKDPAYPHQDKGEMIDTPKRSMSSFGGHYTTNTPPRKRAMVIRKVVEFYTFWIGPGGEICKVFKWGFTVTWKVREGDDPFSEDGKNRAEVSTDFTDPTAVDKDSEEGKTAKAAYDSAMKDFKS